MVWRSLIHPKSTAWFLVDLHWVRPLSFFSSPGSPNGQQLGPWIRVAETCTESLTKLSPSWALYPCLIRDSFYVISPLLPPFLHPTPSYQSQSTTSSISSSTAENQPHYSVAVSLLFPSLSATPLLPCSKRKVLVSAAGLRHSPDPDFLRIMASLPS